MSTELTIPVAINTAKSLAVTDKATLEQASTIRTEAKKFLKQITEEKEKVTKPLNEALKAERARFKPFEDQLDAVITHLDKQMIAYQSAEAARVKEQEAKIAARVGEGRGHIKPETAIAKLAAIDTVDKNVGGTRFVTDYEVVVTDIRAIPDEFVKIEVRTMLVKAALKAGQKIAGVELKEIQRPVVA